MSLAMPPKKPEGNREYVQCKCGRPATVFLPSGEGMCKSCAAVRRAMMPRKRRKR